MLGALIHGLVAGGVLLWGAEEGGGQVQGLGAGQGGLGEVVRCSGAQKRVVSNPNCGTCSTVGESYCAELLLQIFGPLSHFLERK